RATSASTRGVGFHAPPPRRSATTTKGTSIPAASAMRQNADAVGPMCTHFTNTAEVLISTAPSSMASNGPRGAASRTEFLGVFEVFGLHVTRCAPGLPTFERLDRIGERACVVVHLHAIGREARHDGRVHRVDDGEFTAQERTALAVLAAQLAPDLLDARDFLVRLR